MDSKGVKWNWLLVDPMAASTKEMTQGNWHDELDGQFGYNNFQKNIGLCKHRCLCSCQESLLTSNSTR